MEIKIIATGSTKFERFIKRWGVSFLIGEDVLFDTFGDPGVLLNNMRKFNIDPAKIKHIVLSHDDWDHVAGLWYLLHERDDLTVYTCPGFNREIKTRIASFPVKVIEAEEVTLIKKGIYSTGQLYGESEGRKIYEQSLVIKTSDGLAVICGCAHPGVVKIVQHVKANFQAGIQLLAGGFHMKDNTDLVNRGIIEKLRKLGVAKIAPTHCTGGRAARLMRQEFKKDYMRVREGEIIKLVGKFDFADSVNNAM